MTISSGRAAYVASIADFYTADPAAILGVLSQAQSGEVTHEQRRAWQGQITLLREALSPTLSGLVCFEFTIPRLGKRVDNIVVIGDHVLVVEFKIGADTYEAGARTQVLDYALDLRNFHLGSHGAYLMPVLVATEAPPRLWDRVESYDRVYPVLLTNRETLVAAIDTATERRQGPDVDAGQWLAAGYRPTPTIIEASQALYRGHQVRDITHAEAGADNLGITTAAMGAVIDQARATGGKHIILVSGVPGAGKTLAGLNLVGQRRQGAGAEEEHAVFLSGNGPLVQVLQEALARDEVDQARQRGQRLAKTEALRKAHAFIQNVHHFRDESLKDRQAPVERVVVFDEAQRAWNREQTAKFMQQKRGHAGFDESEPEFLISVMDRHQGWAVIVALIGGGQEINTGEAGLEAWLVALRDRFPAWQVHLPPYLDTVDYLPSFDLASLGARAHRDAALHLGVSLRSFRAERLAVAVGALMRGDVISAAAEVAQVLPNYPIRLTRSLAEAKTWVRQHTRGSERCGILASSGARRLKPLGITMEVTIDPCMWFLNGPEDVRSSFYLEDAASEFDVQGLELDWAVVVWDGDLVHQGDSWRFRAFKGTKWQEIRDADAQRYRRNAYRVLLTRARQGMVIVVPEGDPTDPTRAPDWYDPTWDYLRALGIPAPEVIPAQALSS